MKKSDAVVALSRITFDTSLSLLAFVLAYFLRMQWYEISLFKGLHTISLFPAPNTLYPFALYWEYALQFTLVLLVVMAAQGRYRLGADEKLLDELQQTFWGIAASMALLLGYFFFAQEYFFSRLIFGLAWGLTILFIWKGRVFIRLLRQIAQHYGWGVQRILLLGTGHLATQVQKQCQLDSAVKIVGLLTETKITQKIWQQLPIWGSFKQLGAVLKKQAVDEVWLATENSSSQLKAQLVAQSHRHHTKFKFFPDELALDLAAVKVSTMGALPIITLLNSPLHGWWAVVKFALDFITSLLALLLLSPFLFVVGIVVWSSNLKAPVLYASNRVGADGKIFKCYKFRTMVVNADAQKAQLMKKNERQGGVLFKLSDDPRITTIGHFLRKYSIDELPQLWNVFKGDMSLIGPRPHLVEEVKKYPAHNRELLMLRPGLTGMAQINGRSSLSFEDEMKHEMFYLKNWSLWLDFTITLKTILVVLKGENAN